MTQEHSSISTSVTDQLEKQKSRRIMAKRWLIMTKGSKYRRIAAKSFSTLATRRMEQELFDDDRLNFRSMGGGIASKGQVRLLHRIVEKRQAQAVRHWM